MYIDYGVLKLCIWLVKYVLIDRCQDFPIREIRFMVAVSHVNSIQVTQLTIETESTQLIKFINKVHILRTI